MKGQKQKKTMQKAFSCQICDCNNWIPIESYDYMAYRASKIPIKFAAAKHYIDLLIRVIFKAKPRDKVIANYVFNDYISSRLEVLFSIWFNGSQSVELKSIYCSNCGFSCYTPRPTDDDIKAKYSYLIANSLDYKKKTLDIKESHLTHLDHKRSSRIYKKCIQHRHGKTLDVLDYGGGNGANMRPFLEKGHNCYIVDYNKNIIQGIRHIGADIDCVDFTLKFDTIICSHVLEHVSEFSRLINKLKHLLTPNGIIYAEVPLEVFAGIPIENDPVTHINFFTLNSLSNLFLSQGFEILESKSEILEYSTTHLHAAWIVAKSTGNSSLRLLPSDIYHSLYPSRNFSIAKLLNLLLRRILIRITRIIS